MKASELRIGNLVKVPTTDGSDVFTQIEPSNYCHEWNSEISIESYNPIPLTEEWLVKFGFVKTEDIFKNIYHSIEKFQMENINYFVGITETKLLYVHQLQNLYFALTGEELTLKEKL